MVRLTVIGSVAVGLLSTATVVVQALTLGSLLASAMPGAPAVDRGRDMFWFAVAVAVRGAAGMAGEVLARIGASWAKADLRHRLLTAALRQAPGRHDQGVGNVATLAGRGLDALDVYVGKCLPDFVLAAAAPVALVVAVGALDWLSGLVVVVALGLFPVFGALVGKASGALASERWRQVEYLGRQVVDVFEGLPVLKAFARTAHQRARIEQTGEALRRASLDTLKVAFLSALVLDELASVSVAMVAVPLGLRLLHGTVRLSSALAVLIIAPEVFVPLRRASAEFHQSSEGLAAAASAMDLLVATEPSQPQHTRKLGSPADPIYVPVSLQDVRVDVPGRAAPVLADCSLRIEPGETVCLVGPNGAGKSTVISVLLGLCPASSGSVQVGDDDLAGLDLTAWRQRIAYLPEHPTLVADTLAANLRLANPAATDAEMVDALLLAGAGELVQDLPLGLATRMGEGGQPTSAGERQRIALARLILRPASLYLLDEPTVHLDGPSEAATVELLKDRLQGRSALIITHRPALLELADRVIELSEGRVRPLAVGPLVQVPA